MLESAPVEMSDGALERIYPELGIGTSHEPLEELYPLLEDLNDAMLANAGKPFNPTSHTIFDFRWAHVKTGGTTQLCAESIVTRKVLSPDAKLVPEPEGTFQGYMLELVDLSRI